MNGELEDRRGGRAGRHASVVRGISLAALLLIVRQSSAEPRVAEEYDMKAAFILNIARFVEWPSPAFQSDSTPINVCLVGPDPFGGRLERALEEQHARGRKFRIQHFKSARDAHQGCHISYFAAPEKPALAKAPPESADGLTIGETRNFASQGGMIGLYIEGERLKFEVNLEAVSRAHLKLSSQVLKLAKLVQE